MAGNLPEQFKKAKKKITEQQKEINILKEHLKIKTRIIVRQDAIIGELNLKILEAKI